MNKTYVLSGYFAEGVTGHLHKGHIRYIQTIQERMDDTDRMIIIVNNDYQRIEKYNELMKKHMDFRLAGPWVSTQLVNLIKSYFPNKNIQVWLSKSKDRTVCVDLERVAWFYSDRKQVVFVKDGGEYNKENLPEKSIKGIEFLFLNNEKEDNASEILFGDK